MKNNSSDKHLELIEKLRKGKMLTQPGVAFHVNKALTTGDYSGITDYLTRYPAILAAS